MTAETAGLGIPFPHVRSSARCGPGYPAGHLGPLDVICDAMPKNRFPISIREVGDENQP
jgi:hypothetical protein